MDMAVTRAIEILNSGGLVAYPTETFYAIGARFDNEATLDRLYELKGRSNEKAISLIIGSADDVSELTDEPSSKAQELMKAHWPGPLTLVLPANDMIGGHITQLGTIALRVPGESFALTLARAAGFAITATSANQAGSPPADTAQAVTEYFNSINNSIDLLIDGGKSPGGRPSTIVDVTGSQARVLRAGALKLSSDELGQDSA